MQRYHKNNRKIKERDRTMTIAEKINFIERRTDKYRLHYFIPTKTLTIESDKGVLVEDFIFIKRLFAKDCKNFIVKSRWS